MDKLDKEKALETLKSNLHLPGGGYHSLIVELSRIYQLPFQTVRKVLKEAQVSIEAQIRSGTGIPDEECLTSEHWQSIAEAVLKNKTAGRAPVMRRIKDHRAYREALEVMEKTCAVEAGNEHAKELLDMVYAEEVYQPLRAMLYTTHIIWKLKEDLSEMSEDKWIVFKGYPEYVDAAIHLRELREENRYSVE